MKKNIHSVLQLVPVILSFILLGAHFLRYGNSVLMVGCLLLPLLLFIRRPLAARIIQFALFLAAAEWAYTAYNLAAAREAMGMPWTRVVVILGGVAIFTAGSIFVFFSQTQKERYSLFKQKE